MLSKCDVNGVKGVKCNYGHHDFSSSCDTSASASNIGRRQLVPFWLASCYVVL